MDRRWFCASAQEGSEHLHLLCNTGATGDDLEQANAAAVSVDGLTKLEFTAGQDSHGGELPAPPNRALLHRAGMDATDELVPRPAIILVGQFLGVERGPDAGITLSGSSGPLSLR